MQAAGPNQTAPIESVSVLPKKPDGCCTLLVPSPIITPKTSLLDIGKLVLDSQVNKNYEFVMQAIALDPVIKKELSRSDRHINVNVVKRIPEGASSAGEPSQDGKEFTIDVTKNLTDNPVEFLKAVVFHLYQSRLQRLGEEMSPATVKKIDHLQSASIRTIADALKKSSVLEERLTGALILSPKTAKQLLQPQKQQ